jgi:hypothetical protein
MSLWKCRAVENVENQNQVFHVSHRAWKSQKTRFPHSHRLNGDFLHQQIKTLACAKSGRKPKTLARNRQSAL